MPRREWILLGLLGIAVLACGRQQTVAVATPAPSPPPVAVQVPPPPTAPPVPKATPTPLPMQYSTAVLTDALRHLENAPSYRFSITATLSYAFEGKPVDWRYQGQGAVVHPDSWEWAIEGQADTTFRVISVSGQTVCADTRGPLATSCSLAWGGPSPGLSPYTAITYLRYAEEISELETKQVDGREYYYFQFLPSLAKLSGIDRGHQEAMRQVSKVTGEVWVDKEAGALRREVVTASSVLASGREQKGTTSLTFFDFGQAVDIRLPSPGG